MKKDKIKTFFKDLPFGLIIGALVGVVVVVLAVLVNEVITNLEFATGILAIATIILALAAFWAIRQNYYLHKRERRERLLNEIIEWATNILESEIEVPAAPLQTGLADTKVLMQFVHFDLLVKYRKVDARSGYSMHISSYFEETLRSAVNDAANKLNVIIEQLTEHPSTTTEQEIRELRESLEPAALAVIEEAAKIKIRI